MYLVILMIKIYISYMSLPTISDSQRLKPLKFLKFESDKVASCYVNEVTFGKSKN